MGEIIGERGTVYKCTSSVHLYTCTPVHMYTRAKSQARMGEIIGERGTVYTCTLSVHLYICTGGVHLYTCTPEPGQEWGDHR